jgi:hypothetical protein
MTPGNSWRIDPSVRRPGADHCPLPCCAGKADGGLCVTTIVFLSAVAVFFFGWPRKCR